MDDEQDQEKRNRGAGLTWWVRYAFVPVAVALIAGFSAVRAADLLKPIPTMPPVATGASTPNSSIVPTPTETVPQAVTLPAPTSPLPTPAPTAITMATAAPAAITTATPAPTETSAEPAPTAIPTLPNESQASAAILGKHTVQRGETLFCIGRGYGVAPLAIARVNNLANPALLRTGQVLDIPDVEWQNVPDGLVCRTQFGSPYAGRAVNIPPVSPAQQNPKPPAPKVEATPTETPIETAPPTEAPTPYPYPEG